MKGKWTEKIPVIVMSMDEVHFIYLVTHFYAVNLFVFLDVCIFKHMAITKARKPRTLGKREEVHAQCLLNCVARVGQTNVQCINHKISIRLEQ